jgi:D-alanyl-D-alanine carboxypeptidase (penicillin-binding protein 5/6)
VLLRYRLSRRRPDPARYWSGTPLASTASRPAARASRRTALTLATAAALLTALTSTAPAQASTAAQRATPTAAREPAIPCPIAKVPPPTGRPAKPPVAPVPPPTRAPDAPVVGGDRLASTGLVVPDGARRLPTTLTAQAWVVADLDSGDILGACAPHAYHPPASTQKLLTILVALGKLDPKQVITVTPGDLAFEPGSSAVGLVKGGKYTVETVILGLLLASGNDAANVVARLAGGGKGVPGTIEAMNAEARRLGALDTTAVTPSGLDGPRQYTSAYDLALIARADFANPDFRRYTATERTVIPAQPPKFKAFQIQNDNRLLTQYDGAIGGKTGFTDLARHTYVGAAERNGRRLVVTMLRGEPRPQRLWQQGAALLDWGFALPKDAKPVGRLVKPGEDLTPGDGKQGGAAPAAQLGQAARPQDGLNIADVIGVLLVLGTFGLGTWWIVRNARRTLSRRRR